VNPISSWFWPAVVGGTIALGFFSWFVSIRAKRYHGIARFFAFESILLLTLLNIPLWFREPFSPLQILSWLFLIASLLLAIHGIGLYFKLSAPRGQFENSTRLVVRGAYRYIRHPMYVSIAVLGLGIWLKRISALTSVLVAVDLLAVYATARIEEGEMRARFGSEYSDYVRKTKMFLPYLFFLLVALLPPCS
jgi:protein-S-isoprenylcysteine O-methyltransferase Ste14